MSDSVKQSAIIFKKRAKELGYEIKLTHCQEILAQINGHKTRHSYLLENKTSVMESVEVISNESPPLNSQESLSQFLNYLITMSKVFNQEELELIKSKSFQENIEKVFFENLVRTVISENKKMNKSIVSPQQNIKGNKDILASEYIFDFDFQKGFINNIKNMISKVDDSSYSFKKYLENLDKGKYRDLFFLGLKQKDNKVIENSIDYFESPHALYIGAMGSGKTVANVFTTITWMLANSNQSIMYIVDTIKGANDYQQMFKYNQVVPLIGSELEFKNLLNELYSEAISRRNEFAICQAKNLKDYENKTGKKLARILVVIEEFRAVAFSALKFDHEYQNEGSLAYKYNQLMMIGGSLGIWFNVCIPKGTNPDMPLALIPKFTQKLIFRVSRPEASYFLGNTKAADIRVDQKGRCETDNGTVQFPFLTFPAQEKLLDKYMKKLNADCLHIDASQYK